MERVPQKTRASVNRAWIRNLLAQKQPEFAAVLEQAMEELAAMR